jgi:hypothetical protein
MQQVLQAGQNEANVACGLKLSIRNDVCSPTSQIEVAYVVYKFCSENYSL